MDLRCACRGVRAGGADVRYPRDRDGNRDLDLYEEKMLEVYPDEGMAARDERVDGWSVFLTWIVCGEET